MKKKILIGVLVIAILTLIYWQVVQYIQNNTIGKPFEFEPDDETPPPTNYQLGCGTSSFPTTCSGLSMNTPVTNVGCCGDVVGAFQDQLITLGQPITKDGKYGNGTKDAHQNALTEMGGTWNIDPVVVDAEPNTQMSGVDANGNMWYIDPESGAVIYV
tara:strand:- start:7319 stop:7792 length:474 start_codon:yes stop_codon:yes gene_type:complete